MCVLQSTAGPDPRPEVAVATVVRHDGATHTDASPRGSHCGVFIDVNDVGDYPSCTGGTTAIITTTTATTTPARAHTTAHLEHNGMGRGRVHAVFRLKLALVGTVRPLRTGHRPRACRGSSSTRLHRAENVCALRSVSALASIAIHPIDTAFLRPHLLWPIAWWPPTIVSSGLQIDTHPKEAFVRYVIYQINLVWTSFVTHNLDHQLGNHPHIVCCM